MERKIVRLKAIVVVPTRELANQVLNVFQLFTKDFGLKVQIIVFIPNIIRSALLQENVRSKKNKQNLFKIHLDATWADLAKWTS